MKFAIALVAAVVIAATSTKLIADTPGAHPHYLQALSDLRAAKWNIEHRPGDFKVSEDEALAVSEINIVITDLKNAALDDGKDINDHPAADDTLDYRGHLHRALDLLRKAHAGINREEDDKAIKGLQHRSIRHLDRAIRGVKKAIHAAEQHP
jgi:hypothetical protein